jgi:hypothetical protein
MTAQQFFQPSETRVTDFTFQKYAKLKPHAVIIQKRFVGTKPLQAQENQNSLLNLEKGRDGQYNGYMSPGTRRKVKGIIENYLTAVQLSTPMQFPKSFPSTDIYPTFLTLTLPGKQYHCDLEIKEQFAHFMEYLTGSKERGNSGWNVKNYIWVSETQKNGNIHFHVIIDRALPASRIQEEWNRILERLGYITFFRNRQNYIYQDGFFVRKNMMDSAIAARKKFCRATSQKFSAKDARKAEEKRQREAYERGVKCNWNNPPTTKIHAIQNIKKLTAYVSKYMTKEPELVNYPLEPGQKLVQENGKYYVDTETIEQSISIEGIELETVSKDRKSVNVNFLTRRLRGRIWGASKSLHVEDLNPYTVALESFNRVTITTTTYRDVVIKEPVYEQNIFGEMVFSHMERTIKKVPDYASESYIESPEVDATGNRWVQWLTEEHVPKADIEKATAKAGDHFAHYGGVIIPLDYPQKDLLRAYSPDLYSRYENYYKGMFETLYPSVKNAG